MVAAKLKRLNKIITIKNLKVLLCHFVQCVAVVILDDSCSNQVLNRSYFIYICNFGNIQNWHRNSNKARYAKCKKIEIKTHSSTD